MPQPESLRRLHQRSPESSHLPNLSLQHRQQQRQRPHQSAQRLPLPVPAPCPILQACEHQPFHSPSGVSGSPSITRGGAPASTRVIGTPRPLVATVATGAPLSTATKGAALSVMTTGKPGIMLEIRCWTGVAAAADLQSDSRSEERRGGKGG